MHVEQNLLLLVLFGNNLNLVCVECYFHKTGLTSFYFIFQLDVTNKRIIHMEEGLRVFIKVQLGLFSALIVLFAVVMYFAIHPM